MKRSGAFWVLWVVLATMLMLIAACGDDDDDDNDAADDDATDDDTVSGDDDDNDDNDDNDDDNDDDDDDDEWQPVDPHRESHLGWTIVWLAGTPYEMGYQQGELLHDELKAGVDWLNEYHLIDLLLPVARLLGLTDLARENSYPEIVEECEGLVDAAGDVGWSMDLCLLLNFGDVLVEFLSEGFPPAADFAPGCSEIVATGDATVDGRLYHGRILDWSKIDFLLDYPVIFVRQPEIGIPHAYIGFPGNISPYSGINAAGVAVASNEADPLDNTHHDRVGRSHVQMQAMLLKNATSYEDARAFIEEQDHMTVEIITVSDGVNRQGAAFEMTNNLLGVRELEDGVVYATNHFVAPETADADAEPAGESSLLRFDRLAQLVPRDGEDTLYGQIDSETIVAIMRDRINPYTHEQVPADVFDNNGSLATNGAIYQIVFDPENLWFWVAGGEIPVPRQTFVGFSLSELLGLPDAKPVEPAVFE